MPLRLRLRLSANLSPLAHGRALKRLPVLLDLARTILRLRKGQVAALGAMAVENDLPFLRLTQA